MSLVTAVIMPVKIFIYSYTNLIFVENSYINILKEEYGTICYSYIMARV